MRSVRHSNIVHFYGAGYDADGVRGERAAPHQRHQAPPSIRSCSIVSCQDPFLVTELMPRGSLTVVLKDPALNIGWEMRVRCDAREGCCQF